MKLILLCENDQIYSSKRLIEEATTCNLDIEWVHPYRSSIFIDVRNDKKLDNTFVIHRCTGIRFDEYDITVSSNFEQQGAIILNPISTIELLRDKEKQQLFFKKHQIPCIPSLSFRGKLSEVDFPRIIEPIEKVTSDNKYILKTIRGNKGIGVNLLDSKESLASVLETFWALNDQKFIIQPFVKGDEYRIFVVDGKITGAIKKLSFEKEFRKNSNRASGEFVPFEKLEDELIEVALKTFKKSGAFYAGIDILYSNNQYKVLEFNLVPGFELMEKLSGINQAKIIIEAAITRIKNATK